MLCSSYPAAAGDPFDWNYEPVASSGGAISVTPNLDGGQGPLGVIPEGIGYDCKFFHVALAGADDVQANPTSVSTPVGPDDVQANPTAPPTDEPIDDVQANPAGSGTLTVRTWICPPAYDPVAGSALEDCTEAHNGVTFDLVNHAAGQPDFQAATGDVIDGAALFEPLPGTYSLKEQLPDGYGEPFLWDCTGLTNIPDDLDSPLSTINFFRIVIDSGQEIECDWMSVPAGAGLEGADDLQANPTEVPEIDSIRANPPGSNVPSFRAGAKVCPAGFDTNVLWMDIFQA